MINYQTYQYFRYIISLHEYAIVMKLVSVDILISCLASCRYCSQAFYTTVIEKLTYLKVSTISHTLRDLPVV